MLLGISKHYIYLQRRLFVILVVSMLSGIKPSIPFAHADGGAVNKRQSLQERSILQFERAIFMLRGTNGYTISVSGSRRGVRLVASRRHQAVVYFARDGWASRSGVEANFGKLGKISMRFHPNGKSADRVIGVFRHCHIKNGAPDQAGAFVGRLNFRGERNFTSVNRRHVTGWVAPQRELGCPIRKNNEGGRARGPSFGASELTFPSRGSLRLASFQVGAEASEAAKSLAQSGVPLELSRLPRKGVKFAAQLIEERIRLLIFRIVVATGGDQSLKIGERSTTAQVTPPSPFSGTAKYRACDSVRAVWHGSIDVPFPGKARVSLAGKRFNAELKPQGKCMENFHE